MVSKVGNSLLLRSGVVIVAILAVTGFATGIIPVRCLVGKACAPDAQVAAPANIDVAAAPENVSVSQPAASVVASTEASSAAAPTIVADLVPPKPTLTSNDVIASTFALLPAELQKPVLDAGSARPKSLTAASSAPANGDLKTRKVRTVTVRADGTPLLPDDLVTQAYANTSPSSAELSPAIEAVTRVSAGEEPVASAEPPPAAKPAPAKADLKTASTGPTGKTGTIAGSGSNVRAAPGKSGKVLFVLGAGEVVKLGENSKGWIKVTDDQGRSGWVYKTFIN